MPMRITHPALQRNYLKRMNTNLSNLTKSNEKMSSQRVFEKGYENVSDAGKALKIRRMIQDNERYNKNIRDVEGRVAAAEDSLRSVNGVMISIKDRVVEGLNGTMSPDDRKKIATELSKLQEEVLQVMNTQYSDKYVFAASGNENGKAPFEVINNALFYNGTRVDSMEKDPLTGAISHYVDSGGGVMVLEPIPYNKDNYVDIGFGYKILDNGQVDPNTAFKETFSGVESFGYGLTADGLPLNAYSLIGRMTSSLDGNDMDTLGQCLDTIPTSMNFMLTAITEIGARGRLLEDTGAQLDTELENLLKTQNGLEGLDITEEAIHNASYQMSWMVTLQLGSRILPQTIFNFIQ